MEDNDCREWLRRNVASENETFPSGQGWLVSNTAQDREWQRLLHLYRRGQTRVVPCCEKVFRVTRVDEGFSVRVEDPTT